MTPAFMKKHKYLGNTISYVQLGPCIADENEPYAEVACIQIVRISISSAIPYSCMLYSIKLSTPYLLTGKRVCPILSAIAWHQQAT